MKTKIVLGILIGATLTLAGASVARAQTYYGPPDLAACTVILRDLSYGMRGSEVLSLQKSLVSQNYPGGGVWMQTGYFGPATRTAVMNFQGSQGLSQTGIADTHTRAAIAQATCDGLFPSSLYGYGMYGTYPAYPPYQHPYIQPYHHGYAYGSPYIQNPFLSSLTPTSGPVGSSVTVRGSGFSTQGNSVRFGQILMTGLNSSDGQTLVFIVPQQGTTYGYQYVAPGSYDVSVITADGRSSNSIAFTVTGYSYQSAAPTISGISGPTYLPLGSQGQWSFTASDWSSQYLWIDVKWGDNYWYVPMTASQTLTSQSNQTVTLTHAYAQRGTYTITFTARNQQGQQSTATASVTVY